MHLYVTHPMIKVRFMFAPKTSNLIKPDTTKKGMFDLYPKVKK